jgi:hypothetical protein
MLALPDSSRPPTTSDSEDCTAAFPDSCTAADAEESTTTDPQCTSNWPLPLICTPVPCGSSTQSVQATAAGSVASVTARTIVDRYTQAGRRMPARNTPRRGRPNWPTRRPGRG